jgi:hypothetical protein
MSASRQINPGAVLILAGALSLGACSEPTPTQNGLEGRWIEEGVATESARDLLMGQPGVFVFTVPSADGAVTFVSGDWKVEGDHITFTTTSKTEYSASGSSKKTEPYVDQLFFQDATFTLTPSTLTLTYTAYPSGAPVVTTTEFRRVQ